MVEVAGVPHVIQMAGEALEGEGIHKWLCEERMNENAAPSLLMMWTSEHEDLRSLLRRRCPYFAVTSLSSIFDCYHDLLGVLGL